MATSSWAVELGQVERRDRVVLGGAEKEAIVRAIWPHVEDPVWPTPLYNEFFEYVASKLDDLNFGAAYHLPLILDTITWLRTNPSVPPSEHLESMRSNHPNVDYGTLKAHIAASSTIMISIPGRGFPLGVLELSPLSTLITGRIAVLAQAPPKEDSALDPVFNAASLCNIFGYKIEWTDDWTGHLTLNQRQKSLTLYYQYIYACNYAECSDPAFGTLKDLAAETLDTYNLLFPAHDDEVDRLLDRHSMMSLKYIAWRRDRQLHLGRYKYWGNRLAKINRLYQAPPKGILQIARDPRRKTDWYNFLLALVVGLIGIPSLAFSIVSMVYTMRQYELARAQACLDANVARGLPQYC